MEILESFISSYALPILSTIITAVASFIGVSIKNAYEKHIDTKTKKEIVSSTVSYIEQIATSLGLTSEEKKAQAKEKVLEWLNEKGMVISETELEILIESAVNALGGN